jgi:hypothetical protein
VPNLRCSVCRARRFALMSSRTAACGHPPVSMAEMRSGARALFRVRNSASSLYWAILLLVSTFLSQSLFLLPRLSTHFVKISLVTAAMLYSSLKARHNFNMRAVLPDPTGLQSSSHTSSQRIYSMKERKSYQEKEGDKPANANCISSIFPVPPLVMRERLLAIYKRAWSVIDLV